ncbi:MAG TPA: YceI family protein [Gemmatimonadales bacterium]
MTATLEAHDTATIPWQIDSSHTEVEFSARHLMISNVKGRFSSPSGTVRYDPAHGVPLDLEVTVPIDTIDTRNAQRDAHLRSADFFDAEHFPTMTFKGRHIEGDITKSFKLIGELTIRGTTRDVTLDVTSEGNGPDPWGNDRLGFSATATINRTDFGLLWNQLLETGGVAVSDQIKIIINTELMRPRAPKPAN